MRNRAIAVAVLLLVLVAALGCWGILGSGKLTSSSAFDGSSVTDAIRMVNNEQAVPEESGAERVDASNSDAVDDNEPRVSLTDGISSDQSSAARENDERTKDNQPNEEPRLSENELPIVR